MGCIHNEDEVVGFVGRTDRNEQSYLGLWKSSVERVEMSSPKRKRVMYKIRLP